MTERNEINNDRENVDRNETPIDYFERFNFEEEMGLNQEYDINDYQMYDNIDNNFNDHTFSNQEVNDRANSNNDFKQNENSREENTEDRKKEGVKNGRDQLNNDLKKLEEVINKKSQELNDIQIPTEGMSQKEVSELNAQKQAALDELTNLVNEWSLLSDKVQNMDLELEKSEKLGKDVGNPVKDFIESAKERLHNAVSKVTEFVDNIKFDLKTRNNLSDLFAHKNEEVKQSFYEGISEDAKIFEEEFVKTTDFADPEINDILNDYVNVINKYDENKDILNNLGDIKDQKISDVYENQKNNSRVQKAKEKLDHNIAHASDVSRFEQAKMGAFIIHDAVKGKGDSRIIEYNLKTDDPEKIAKNIDKSMEKYNKTIAMNNKLIAPKVKLVQAWAAKTSIVAGAKAYRAEQKMTKIQKDVYEKHGKEGLQQFNKMAQTIQQNDKLADKGAQVADYAKSIGVSNLSKFMKEYNEFSENKQPTEKMQAKYELIEAKANELGLHLKKPESVVNRENTRNNFTQNNKTSNPYDVRKENTISKTEFESIKETANKAGMGKINNVNELIKNAKSDLKKNSNDSKDNKDKKNEKNEKNNKSSKEEQEFSI